MTLERQHGSKTTLPRRLAIAYVVLLAWLVALSIAVFSPTSTDPNRLVSGWGHLLRDAGVPHYLATTALWQVLFNALIFVPVGALAPLIIPVRGTAKWLGIGLACGALIETTQGFLLPHRDASFVDAVTNGFGVCLGYIVLGAARRVRSKSSGPCTANQDQ